MRGRESIPGPSRAVETRAARGATTEHTRRVCEGGATKRCEADRPIRRREGIDSRPLTRILFLSALLLSSGCFRLSDPVYAFKGLRASEPERPGDSLVFGTIALEGLFSGSVDTVVLRRASPRPGEFTGVTEEFLFRVFQRRPMKDGSFVLTVEPGAYEIVELRGSGWISGRIIRFGEKARIASRFVVTRPGVYDLGIVRLHQTGAFGSFYEGVHERGDADPRHAQLLREAIAGTSWERFLGEARP